MAKQKELVALLQQILPRLAADIDHRTRVLRQGDDPILPSGGRGPYAPDLRPVDAAHIVIGAMSLERPKAGNVEKEVRLMAGLRRDDIFHAHAEKAREGGERRGLKGCDSFLDTLVMAFTEGFHVPVLGITIYPMSHRAIVQLCSEEKTPPNTYLPGESYWFSELNDEDDGEPIDVAFELHLRLISRIQKLVTSPA